MSLYLEVSVLELPWLVQFLFLSGDLTMDQPFLGGAQRDVGRVGCGTIVVGTLKPKPNKSQDITK